MVGVTFSQKVVDFANIFKAFIGASYLSMPFAFSQSGIILGIIMLLVVGWLTDHCSCKMVRCKSIIIERLLHQFELKLNNGLLPEEEAQLFRSGELKSRWESRMTLSHISKYVYGKKAQWFVAISLFVSQFGFCTSYFVFVGNTLYEMVNYDSANNNHTVNTTTPHWHHSTPNYSYNVTTITPTLHSRPKIDLIYLVMIPFPIFALSALLRSVRKIGWISAIATVTVTFAFFAILGLLINDFTLHKDIPLAKFTTLPIVFGMLTCSFEGIGTVISIESSMVGNRHNYNTYLHVSLAMMVFILCSFGIVGYLRYGDGVEQIIIQSMPFSIFLSIINSALIINVICTYPLQMFPVVEIAEFLFFRKTSADLQQQRETNVSQEKLTYDSTDYQRDVDELIIYLSNPDRGNLDITSRRFTSVTLDNRVATSINYGSCMPQLDTQPNLRNNNSESIFTKKEERMIRIIHGAKITAPAWKRNSIRVILVILQMALAIAMRYKYAYLNSFIGALSASFLAYILPAAAHRKLIKGTDAFKCGGCGDILIIIFGVIGSITSFAVTLKQVIENK